MVSAMDEAVGLILKKFVEKDMMKDTVFFFTSDNGGLIGAGGSNWPFR